MSFSLEITKSIDRTVLGQYGVAQMNARRQQVAEQLKVLGRMRQYANEYRHTDLDEAVAIANRIVRRCDIIETYARRHNIGVIRHLREIKDIALSFINNIESDMVQFPYSSSIFVTPPEDTGVGWSDIFAFFSAAVEFGIWKIKNVINR